jgi:hypothetical protein
MESHSTHGVGVGLLGEANHLTWLILEHKRAWNIVCGSIASAKSNPPNAAEKVLTGRGMGRPDRLTMEMRIQASTQQFETFGPFEHNPKRTKLNVRSLRCGVRIGGYGAGRWFLSGRN